MLEEALQWGTVSSTATSLQLAGLITLLLIQLAFGSLAVAQHAVVTPASRARRVFWLLSRPVYLGLPTTLIALAQLRWQVESPQTFWNELQNWPARTSRDPEGSR